jgi:hypothetical protein
MSGKRLRDFILDIRKCKSINEEREVVQAESARVRSDLRNKKTAR